MKIYVKADKKLIYLIVPNFLLKSALLDKVLFENKENELSKEVIKETRIQLYQAVKNHIKKYGHFTLVEVNTSDGERVIIKV